MRLPLSLVSRCVVGRSARRVLRLGSAQVQNPRCRLKPPFRELPGELCARSWSFFLPFHARPIRIAARRVRGAVSGVSQRADKATAAGARFSPSPPPRCFRGYGAFLHHCTFGKRKPACVFNLCSFQPAIVKCVPGPWSRSSTASTWFQGNLCHPLDSFSPSPTPSLQTASPYTSLQSVARPSGRGGLASFSTADDGVKA